MATKPVGVSAQTLEPDPSASREERIDQNKQMLFRSLNTHTTVAFIGSGCSVSFGYPTWHGLAELAVKRSLKALQSVSQNPSIKADRQRLVRFEEQLRAQVSSSQLAFILGVCQRILKDSQGTEAYHKFLQETFRPRTLPEGTSNPYQALLDLPIRRFITSNYDCETERALSQLRAIPFSEFELRSESAYSNQRHRSFTQQPKHYDQLALFSLARVGATDDTVFHCHGHYEEPDSMVVTENDYQRWYLSEKPEAEAFRQTIDLLFSSNPILFVGFSLSDEDLLRTLRMITANRTDRHTNRALFALLPEESEGLYEDDHDFLFERYGVNVIPLLSPNIQERGKDLCRALVNLKNDWLDWWEGFLQKPKIREVQVTKHPPIPYQHYPISQRLDKTFGGERLENLLLDLKRDLQADRRVIALVGRGGTGKSWCAQRLMDLLYQDSDFKGFFFWSSYYANDALTGLDRALLYLDPEQETTGSRLERFAKCLQRDKYFLVFDGVERFLSEAENPERGSCLTPEARHFLKSMIDPANKSTIVLTSRLWPEELGEPDSQTNRVAKRVNTLLFTTDDIANVEPFSWIKERKEISALCSLIDGHIYCIALAAHLLRRAGPERAHQCLKELQRKLIDTPPDRRTQRMIRTAIESLDSEWKGLAHKLLERVALFMTPVGIETINVCYAAADNEESSPAVSSKNPVVKDLIDANLLQESKNLFTETEAVAFTVHPIVRAYVFQQLHRATFDAPPSFNLPGFTSKTVVVDPGAKEKGVKVVLETINRLESAARASFDGKRQKEAIALCRSAFSIIRARMGSNTAPRWCSYPDYIGLISRLWDLAKQVSPDLWDYVEKHDLSSVEDPDGPLYADEMAWLYNEVGLASFSQGLMMNTLSIWEQGYEVNKVIDSEINGRYIFQSLLHMGAAYIHYGRLNIAEDYLREAEKSNYQLDDQDHKARLIGYLALVKHLQGNLKEADSLYEKCLKLLSDAGGNIRAESVFMRHYADLKINFGKYDEAKHLILNSRSLAEAGYFPDLLAYTHNSVAHLLRVQSHFKEALNEFNTALNEARRIGIKRLESEALSEQSRLYYDLGDSDVARQKAIEALKIANDALLGLRQTHGLIVLGKATIQDGQQELGVAYLKHARKLANQQGYFLRKSEAEEELQKYGIEAQLEEISS